MKRKTTYGAATCMALLLASCAATPPQAAEPGSPVVPAVQEMPTRVLLSADGKKAVVHAGASSAPEVPGVLTGSLEADGAGCVILRAPDGETSTLIFPEGTTFEGETLALPDGSALSEGDTVDLAGSRVPANESLSMCLNYARLFSVGME